jgi:transcriptional regulator of heat shock response
MRNEPSKASIQISNSMSFRMECLARGSKEQGNVISEWLISISIQIVILIICIKDGFKRPDRTAGARSSEEGKLIMSQILNFQSRQDRLSEAYRKKRQELLDLMNEICASDDETKQRMDSIWKSKIDRLVAEQHQIMKAIDPSYETPDERDVRVFGGDLTRGDSCDAS